MKKLLSGNEALALGAYHAGVSVASAYPGTPSTEILQALAKFKDIYAEWSTNEKVAMEVCLGAAYAGVRSMVSMKHVGLNVAADPFMAASITGINGGMVVVNADDPGMHSSQNEQDNRNYAKLAKIPVLEPADSQEMYDFMSYAFDISEQFDTPVMLRTTTRVSHSNTVVNITRTRKSANKPSFKHNIPKYVMLPVYARARHKAIEERLIKVAEYSDTFEQNFINWGDTSVGIITCGISYQYAREVFPASSILKLGMPHPLPKALIRQFADKIESLFVIEELDPFLQEQILAMGIKVVGKEYIPITGELSTAIVEEAAVKAGFLKQEIKRTPTISLPDLPARPPLLCPGCPHTGIFFVLSTMGKRAKLLDENGRSEQQSDLILTGDIGCYSLGANPPLRALDTISCMGAGIGEALGMEKAGVEGNIVALIGDSTFMHSGITGLVNAVYNQGKITVVILDNSTTAMTGHQDHPGTGVSAQGIQTQAVNLEQLCRGIGVSDIHVVDAYNIKTLRNTVKSCINNPTVSVIIVQGPCAVRVKSRSNPRVVDTDKCDNCGTCLTTGCAAISKLNGKTVIDTNLCVGERCKICEQLCPKKAIGPITEE